MDIGEHASSLKCIACHHEFLCYHLLVVFVCFLIISFPVSFQSFFIFINLLLTVLTLFFSELGLLIFFLGQSFFSHDFKYHVYGDDSNIDIFAAQTFSPELSIHTSNCLGVSTNTQATNLFKTE